MEGYVTPSLVLLFSPAADPKLQVFLDKSAALTPPSSSSQPPYPFKGSLEYGYENFKLFQLAYLVSSTVILTFRYLCC